MNMFTIKPSLLAELSLKIAGMRASHNDLVTSYRDYSSCIGTFVHEFVDIFGYKMNGTEETYNALHFVKIYLNICE